MIEEYGRWPESRWTAPDINWKKAKAITAGVDVGVVSSQAVVMCDDSLYCYANVRTASAHGGSPSGVMEQALQGTGLKIKDIQATVATGFGREHVPFAQHSANEITCHAQGARFLFGPSVRTVIDMGGHTSKVIKVNEWGKITDLFVNDRCATGMGRGVELLARLLHIPIQDMGDLSLTVKEDPEPVSTTCYPFANTEAVGMLRGGAKQNEILASYLFAVAYRLYTLAGRMKTEQDLALTGGVAKNPGVVKRLEREMGMTALTPKYDPQLAGAIGAAIIARSKLGKSG